TGDSLDATPRAATPQRSCGTRGKSGVTTPPSVGIFLRPEPTAGNWGVTRSGFSRTLRSAGPAPSDASSPTFRRPIRRVWGAGEAGGRAGLAQSPCRRPLADDCRAAEQIEPRLAEANGRRTARDPANVTSTPQMSALLGNPFRPLLR